METPSPTRPGFVVREVSDFNVDLAQGLWDGFAELFHMPLALLNDPLIIALQQAAVGIALAALPGYIAFLALRRQFQVLDGTSDTAPEALVRRAFTAGVAVTATSLYGYVSGTFTNLLLEFISALGLNLGNMREFWLNGSHTLAGAFLKLVFLLGSGLLWIQGGLIAVEYSLLLIGGPLAALGLAGSDQPEAWRAWVRQLMAVCLSRVAQFVTLIMFARRFAGVDPASTGRIVEAIGWLVAVWSQPRLVRQFTSTTGLATFVAGATGGVARAVATRYLILRR